MLRNTAKLNFIKGEVVTIAFLFCLKGVGNRAFYRWLEKDYLDLFPHLPERTRLFRLFSVHQDLTAVFLANPTVMGVIDAYGIELIHPIREGRSEKQIGKKGISNHRWARRRQTLPSRQSRRFSGGVGLFDGKCLRQQISAAD